MIETIYNLYKTHSVVTTDTRNITQDSLFFALKGETFDGNTFAEKALASGAAYVIIDNTKYKINEQCILVDNVLETLQKLALHHRKQLTIPFIGITGTNGKTTTKELLLAVLEKKYKCTATKGNLNNHIGVPLTLLSIPFNAEIAIIEMGANHPYEIEELCKIALPTCGLITNIGKAHLEGFGGFEGVVKTKRELYEFITCTNGQLFVNADNSLLMELSTASKRTLYGKSENANSKGEIIPSNSYLKFCFQDEGNAIDIQTQIIGNYNFENAMAAVCVAQYFNVPSQQIKEALESYTPSNNRSQLQATQRNYLIVDCYNANASSMHAAIDNFANMQANYKMVCLGGMREMGNQSETEHKAIFQLLQDKKFDKIILVGNEFAFAANNSNVYWFKTSEEAKTYLKENPVSGAFVLLKGSRGIAMEKLIDVL